LNQAFVTQIEYLLRRTLVLLKQ